MRTTIGIAIDIPEPAHVTLLGPTEVEATNLAAISDGLAEVAAGHPPFRLLLRGTGTFRPLTEVVFVTVAAGISECEQLNAAIQNIAGVERAAKFPYHPHVTVAQDVPPPQLDAAFRDLAVFTAAFAVDGFTLFEHGPDRRWRAQRDYILCGSAELT
jgi:2'-5' RNA ligase